MFSNVSGPSADTGAARGAPAASAILNQRDQRQSLRLMAAYLFVVLAAAVLLAAQVAAQQPAAQAPANAPAAATANGYEIWEVAPSVADARAVKLMEDARRRMPTDPNPDKNSLEYRAFAAYYNQYIFAKMTHPDFRGELAAAVQDVQNDLKRAMQRNAPAAADMRTWILANADKLAKGNYHPAVRVSATLMLAELDDQLANLSANPPMPPVPNLQAFGKLAKLYVDANAPDGVRAAALYGLHRHVRYGFYKFPANVQTQMHDHMVQLAKSDPPAGRNPAAHAFLQRYAVDILAVLNNQQRSPEVTQTLVGLSSSPTASPVITLYAAESLGRLSRSKELTPIQQADRVVGAWANKAADAFEAEAKRLAALKRPPAVQDQPRLVDPTALRGAQGGYPGGGGGYPGGGGEEMTFPAEDFGGGEMPGGGYGSGEGAGGYGGAGYGGPGFGGLLAKVAQPPEIIASRRKVNAALQSLHLGLTGSPAMDPREPLGLVADEGAKATAVQLVAAIKSSAEALNDATLATEEPFIEMLNEQAADLRKLAASIAPAPAEPAPADAAPPAQPAPAEPDVAAVGAN